ncbi:hypothetical protein CROQUDRAFT_237878 [Cronartium quercuum f. sp. fusiforme G11]|uniref:Uncharacterized protein n=1 Tax=Cronartium quercuum f. sp. fusiforme G11 TaxID=708437 RepID=A0A9P6T7W9_9BASI|nr:hypothetical protein CROQUDRAFT_237878 [Cronartium quercuum f. sp. fusiforme G11]
MSTERSKGKKSSMSTGQQKLTRKYGQMYKTLNGILIKLETSLSSSDGISIVSNVPKVELPKGPTWALIYVLTFLQGCVGTIISILSQAVLLNDEFGLESISLNDKSERTIEMMSNQAKPDSLKNSPRWKLEDGRRMVPKMEKIQDRGEALRASVHVSCLGRLESQFSPLKLSHPSVDDIRPVPFLKRVPERKSLLKSRKEESCRSNLSTPSARCKRRLKPSLGLLEINHV